jgi:hypothetical protein
MMTEVVESPRPSRSSTSDGAVVCWGNNVVEGRSPLTGAFADVAVAGGSSDVTEECVHGCARRPDGTVTCWGQEGYNYAQATTPADAFTQLATGEVHTAGSTPTVP